MAFRYRQKNDLSDAIVERETGCGANPVANFTSKVWTRGVWSLGAGVLVFLVVAAYMGGGNGRITSSERPLLPVTIAASISENAALVWIAEAEGFFRDAGLKATVVPHQFGRLAAEAVLSGEADVATTSEFVVARKGFENDDLRVLASLASTDNTSLVARKDRGIVTPEGLKAKRVGVTPGTIGQFFFDRFLFLHDLSREDLTVVSMRPAAMLEAIGRGELDAAFTWQPFVHRLRGSLGKKAAVFPGQAGQRYYFVLMTNANWLDDHATTAERVLLALVQAERFAAREPEAAKAIIGERFQRDSKYLEATWDDYDLRVTLPQTLLPLLEDDARWLVENGLVETPNVPDFLGMLHPASLHAIEARAVTVIR